MCLSYYTFFTYLFMGSSPLRLLEHVKECSEKFLSIRRAQLCIQEDRQFQQFVKYSSTRSNFSDVREYRIFYFILYSTIVDVTSSNICKGINIHDKIL